MHTAPPAATTQPRTPFVLADAAEAYCRFRAGEEVRQAPGDVPRMWPSGQPLDRNVMGDFLMRSPGRRRRTSRFTFMGHLAPMRRLAADGSAVWRWAHMDNETIH